VDDVNCAESVLTCPPVQNVLLVWHTLLLLDGSLALVEHNILLEQEHKMEVACCSETLVPTCMLHDSEVGNLNMIFKFSQI
jgi:hypothetical protein